MFPGLVVILFCLRSVFGYTSAIFLPLSKQINSCMCVCVRLSKWSYCQNFLIAYSKRTTQSLLHHFGSLTSLDAIPNMQYYFLQWPRYLIFKTNKTIYDIVFPTKRYLIATDFVIIFAITAFWSIDAV